MAGITAEQLQKALSDLKTELRTELRTELSGEYNLAFVCIAKPRIRSLVNQLGLVAEMVYAKQRVYAPGYSQAISPLQPLLDPGHLPKLAALVQQFPALGNTPEQLASNFKSLREERNQEQHLNSPEEVLQELQGLQRQCFMPAFQISDPFLHAAVVGADQFAAQLLAVPRLLKLASLVLAHCQDSLYFKPGEKWSWAEPPAARRLQISQWIAIIIQALPELGSTAANFAKAADQLHADAAELGPLGLYYTLDEIQSRVTLCMDVGLFKGMEEQQQFAYNVIKHIQQLTLRL